MMTKFNMNDKVEVFDYDEHFNGKRGEIVGIHRDLDIEIVYTIKYENQHNKGMFPESSLLLI